MFFFLHRYRHERTAYPFDAEIQPQRLGSHLVPTRRPIMHHVTSSGIRALCAQNVGHAQGEATFLEEAREELCEGGEHLAGNGTTVQLANKEKASKFNICFVKMIKILYYY